MCGRLSLSNLEAKRQNIGKAYILTCILFYVLSVASKGVFAAEISYILKIWSLTQVQVELANTFYFITYGVVQIILFIIMDRINIIKYAFITVPISAIVSIAMGLATGIEGIWVLFALVGVFQAGMYCTCNYLLTKYLPKKLLPTASTLLASGYAIGTAVSYVVSAFFVGFNLWRVPYFVFGGLLLVCTVFLIYQTKTIARFININKKLDNKQLANDGDETVDKKSLPLQTEKPIYLLKSKQRKVAFYITILSVSLILNGLYYGVMSFITRVLNDIYALPDDASIYVTTIIPIVIILGPLITINACEKHKDFIKEAIKFLIILLPLPILLALFYKANIILYLTLIVIYLILANGIRVILNNVVAFKLKDYINVASLIAITNAFASIAASLWPLIIAFVKDNGDWGATYWIITLMIVMALVLCIIIDILVRKTYKKDNDGEILHD